jgi:hypothetical protein
MNRRIRNRMCGGVGGRRGRPLLLPDEDAALPYSMAWDQPCLFIDSGQHVLTAFLKDEADLKGIS